MSDRSDRGSAGGVGLTYWPALESVIEDHQELIDVLEIQPQMLWYRDRSGADICDEDMLEDLSSRRTAKVVHGVGNPVGGSVPPDGHHIGLVADVVDALDAELVSEHLSFVRAPTPGPPFTGFMLPPRQTAEGVEAAVRSAGAMARELGVPFAVENGVNYLRVRTDEMTDGEFLASVVETADVGILLDLHNAYTNERNGRQTMAAFVACLPLERILEIHVAGGQEFEGYWLDAHCGAIPAPVLDFARDLVGELPNLQVINFEIIPTFLRDFGPSAIAHELEACQEAWTHRRVPPSAAEGSRSPAPRVSIHAAQGREAPDISAPSGMAQPSVGQWEQLLAGWILDPSSTAILGDALGGGDLGSDPGLPVLRHLVGEFRAGMIARALTLSTRLLVLHLGEDGTRELLAGFWATQPPHAVAVEEAEAFAAYVTACGPEVAHLDEVMQFELALLRALTDGETTTIGFAADPEQVLGHLARGQMPPSPEPRQVVLTVGVEP